MANKWVDLGFVGSHRDLAEGERVTVSVFDKAAQTVIEQTTFVPKAGRAEQETWVMDLCEQVNAQLKLIRAGVNKGDKLEAQKSNYLNKFWNISDREVQVITTVARNENWTTDKRVNIDLPEVVILGATLQMTVHNAKGVLLETVSFKPTPGRNSRGFCSKDFAQEINKTSLYVRAGRQNVYLIEPVAESWENWIWTPSNADFTVSWSIDLSSLKELGELWSGRDLAEGEQITVNVFDTATQTVLEETTFVPKAGRTHQYTWPMDLCAQVNAKLKLVCVGVPTGSKLKIEGSCYLNKFWGTTDRDVQVITTVASDRNWVNEKRFHLDVGYDIVAGSTLHFKVQNAKGDVLETVSFKPLPGRNTRYSCGKDFCLHINRMSHFVRGGIADGSLIQPTANSTNWIWLPFNSNFKVSWSVDLSSLKELDEVWSGRDLAESERVTVSVFDRATQSVLEQTTFTPKAGRLDQYTWVMDLCEQVNAKLELIRAGVKVDPKLEIKNSGYNNKFWNISDSDVQVITTTARENNWTTNKRVNIDLTKNVKVGSTLQLNVHNSKGKLLETISFKSKPGRSTLGLCAKDFATEINAKSLYVRAGSKSGSNIEPVWEKAENWIWIPFNADFTVTWSLDSTGAWTELGEVWSGRDLAEGERVTVSVFDSDTQAVLEQITFVPKAGRLDQYTWVMDLCEQINAQLKLIRAQDADNGEWLIRNSGHLNKYWGITDRNVQVITTTARSNNWTTDKRVNIDLNEDVVAGATLRLNVHNSKGELLETVNFKSTVGRNTPGFCSKDFALEINKTSLYVRAGHNSGQEIKPYAERLENWIWIPFNADFTVTWSIDLSSLKELGELWSGRDLAEGEQITVNVFDTATQTVLEETTFVPKAGRTHQYTWPMDLCAQVNAKLKLVCVGVPTGSKLKIEGSCYLNKFWGTTDRDVQVITTVASDRNWVNEKRFHLDVGYDIVAGSTLHFKVQNAKGDVLETVSFKPLPGRNTRYSCGKDFCLHINRMSHFVRGGIADGSLIQPTANSTNWIWLPFNSNFKVSWSADLSSLKELDEVWSGRDLAVGEQVTVNVFDRATQTVLEHLTFVPKADRLNQYTWLMDLCEQVNTTLTLVRAGVKVDNKLEIQLSGYLNKYWNITDRDVQVITTAARTNNWPEAKRVNLDISEAVVAGATLRLNVHNSKGALLETVSFKVAHGRSAPGVCGQDFASHINKTSLFVRAGVKSGSNIQPSAQAQANGIWVPFNADFTVSWSIDLSSLIELGEVWSGRDLAEGEQITVNVFDKDTQAVVEQLNFVPKAGRLDQYTWVMDLCEQVNAQLTLVRAGVKVDTRLEVQATGYRNKFWDITERKVQVITTVARINNWPTENRVNLDLGEEVVAGATLHLKVQNSKGALLETVSFKVTPGRSAPGVCGQDFANQINKASQYVRAGARNGSSIQPSAQALENWIWIPFNADFTVTWSIDLSSLKELCELWSGRDLVEGEQITVNVFDTATQTVLEETTFVPKAGRTHQYTWPMDLCAQVNAKLKLVCVGVPTGSKLKIEGSCYLNKFWGTTDRDVQVITTVASDRNWLTEKRVNLDINEKVVPGAMLHLQVHNAQGALLETVSFRVAHGRGSAGLCGQDFANHINKTSLLVRAGVANGSNIQPSAQALENGIWIPFNADFTVSWSVDMSSLIELGEVSSGRGLEEGERITVSVFDKATKALLEQLTFVPKADRAGQFTWPMDLCAQVNSKLKLVCAGVPKDNKLEIPGSCYLNKFWAITDREVEVISTIAFANNWPAEKAVNLDLGEAVMAGATLHLKVNDSKGKVLETVNFRVPPGVEAPGLCGQAFASHINLTSLFVRAGVKDGSVIQPSAQAGANRLWIPVNADFNVSWSIDMSSVKALDEVWSGRDLVAGERITINVFDRSSWTVLEEFTFTPKEGRLDQYTWVMDLCEQVNAKLELVRAGVMAGNNLEIRPTGYLNKFWSITDRDVQVITTTARTNNWPAEKRVALDLAEEIVPGATLHLKVHNSLGVLLETVSFTVAQGRNAPGPCGQDFASEINRKSHFVRAGVKNGSNIQPSAQPQANGILIPFNADFTVSWSVDLSGFKALDEVWSGRDLAVGEQVTVNVFDRSSWTVLERLDFVPKADRLDQYTWVMDLCEQVNSKLTLVRAGVKVGNKLEIQLSGYLNKYWSITDRNVQVITTAARTNNWPTAKRVPLDLADDVRAGAALHLKVFNAKGILLETVHFNVADGRNSAGLCAQDFAAQINKVSHFVRAGVKNGSNIQPSAKALDNWIWIPFNADFTVKWSIDGQTTDEDFEDGWSIDLTTAFVDLGDVRSSRDLIEGERISVNVFDKGTQTILEQTTFVPTAGRQSQYIWAMDLCRHVNDNLKQLRAGTHDDSDKWDVLLSDSLNKYWTWSLADLEVITTAACSDNWTTTKRVKIEIAAEVAAAAVLRVNVRNSFGDLLETLTFTPAAGRTGPGQCGHDLAKHINTTSQLVRAGAQHADKPSLIQPTLTQSANWIWMPSNADFTVTFTTDALKEACKISADREAVEGERITFFAFDDKADCLREKLILTAKASASTLAKDKWPEALGKLIKDSSAYATATATDVSQKYAELRMFTTALHLDNWVEGIKINATAALTAADRIVVKVATTARGNFCEALTFTPNPSRLTAIQWAKDLATYVNEHSLYLKAGVKDTTKKTMVPAEHASNNVLWLPKDSKLKVSYEKTQLKELAPISLQHTLKADEKSYVYVMDDETDVILREITFTPVAGRVEQYAEARDFAAAIDRATELVVAGKKVGDAAPTPESSSYQNKIWGCASKVRAFHTMASMGNWDKGEIIGNHELVENELVVVNVKGKTGRILETLSFTPKADRLTQGHWPKDFAGVINKTSKFIRAGRENTTDDKIEPWHEKDANFFWTPKSSGLVLEMETLKPVAKAVPGMTSEAREVFEQCVESRKYISVDARTGRATLQIPVVDLFADDSFSNPLKVVLSHDAKEGVFIQFGGGIKRLPLVRGANSLDYILTLRDGRNVKIDSETTKLTGEDFKIDAVSKDNRQIGFSVAYKDGVVEEFAIVSRSIATGDAVARLQKYKLPSGEYLECSYSGDHLLKISRGKEVLVKVGWFTPESTALDAVNPEQKQKSVFIMPESIVVYPDGSSEKRTCTFTKKYVGELETTFEIDGFATTGKTRYCVRSDASGKLMGVDVEQQCEFAVGEKKETDKLLFKESLEYAGDKVSRHIIAPPSMDELIQEYSYADKTTTLTGYFKNASPQATFVRYHEFLDQQSSYESHGTSAVPHCKRRSQRVDTEFKRLVTETTTWEGDVPVDTQSMSVDPVGNPVRSISNDEISDFTYYNNYQQFKVTETEAVEEDWSLFGCLLKPVDVVASAFAIGGKSGLTWGTRIDTEVDMKPALNDYAKKAFNLPVAITHCGSSGPFSGEMESELVSRKIGGKEVPQRLTFYGYDNVGGCVRAKQKLIILQPDCARVDVTAEQLVVAEKAAEDFIKSLEKQIKETTGDAKKAFEKTLKDLKASLKAQSEANAEGFKLGAKWKAASMTLETYDYHTEKDKPGYGTVKSTETVQLLDTGAILETSRVKTEFAYSVDEKDTNKLTITTTVSRTGDTSITSSQTRSRRSGRLLESTDSEGTTTVRTYDPEGNLKSEKVTDADQATRETTCTLVRGLGWQYDMVQDEITTRVERDALGRQVAEALKPGTKFLETRRWSFDLQGRVATCTETDYGASDAKIATRETTHKYEALTGKIDITHVLKNGAGTQLHKVTQARTPSARGECFSEGTFSVDRQYNPNNGVMTELYACEGLDSGKIERSMSPEGLTKSVRHSTIADKTETEQDKQVYEHDQYGQLTKATPKFGGATSYTYDSAGRLLTTVRESVTFSNTYDTRSLASVATEGKSKKGDTTWTLGSQTVDMLGRAIDQTVGGHKTQFKYNGASIRSTLETAAVGPTAVTGYSSSNNKKTRTLTQTIGGKSSTVVFSTGGRVVSFTDLTGAVTTYEYDFFNRLTKSSNDHCVCTWTYYANGLLKQETVTAVKESNLKMTVDYTYDGLGQETQRTFTCTGVDTIELQRTLLGDGRLSKSVLKVKEKEMYVDNYEYDGCLRLKKWTEQERRQDGMHQGRSQIPMCDMLGNLRTEGDPASGFINKPGPLAQIPGHEAPPVYTYDTEGRITKDNHESTWSYHGNGQTKSYSVPTRNYTYNLTYDSEGRVRGGSDPGRTDTYHYCGDRVYAVVRTGTVEADDFSACTCVLRNESRACLMQDANVDGTDSRSFELRDAAGSIIASVDLTTKATTYFRYTPYGRSYSSTKTSNWLGFKGEPFNPMGLYHLGNGYRMYDPRIGCFLSPDSKAPFGIGGVAPYGFCNGDPVNHADPSGHEVIAQYSRWGNRPVVQTTAFRIVLGAVGVLLAPFTAGTSMLLVAATTALAAIAFAFDVASIIIAQSDPELSRTLEAWGQAFAIASSAAGIAMGLNGIKGLPRNIFKARGGVSSRVPVKWPGHKVPSELRAAQQARSKALNQLIKHVDEAKAAGKFDAFKLKYLNNQGATVSGGMVQIGGLNNRFKQNFIATGKDLYRGAVRQFDDAFEDFLGDMLDLNSGPVMLVQKFNPPADSETEIKSLLALPMPGRGSSFE